MKRYWNFGKFTVPVAADGGEVVYDHDHDKDDD